MSRRPRYLDRHRQWYYTPVFLTADQRADAQRRVNHITSHTVDAIALAPVSPFNRTAEQEV